MSLLAEVCDHCGQGRGSHLVPDSRCPGEGRETFFFMAAYSPPVPWVDDPVPWVDDLVAHVQPTPKEDWPSIKCPRCSRISRNPNDVREKYCGACHQYHSDMEPPRTDGEFVLAFESDNGDTELWHRGGVAWHDAPIPSRWHRYGWMNYVELMERCACGAIRVRRGRRNWWGRNERRRS